MSEREARTWKAGEYDRAVKLFREMYDEMNPETPTGGNDYHDAWKVFGPQIASFLDPWTAAKWNKPRS